MFLVNHNTKSREVSLRTFQFFKPLTSDRGQNFLLGFSPTERDNRSGFDILNFLSNLVILGQLFLRTIKNLGLGNLEPPKIYLLFLGQVYQ